MEKQSQWIKRGLALLVAASAFAPLQNAVAEMTLLKMGWTYTIGFPEVIQDQVNPRLGLAAGLNNYRVLAYGGDAWYRLQRVYRHPNGGWYTPQGAPQVWVNMGYAYAIHESK